VESSYRKPGERAHLVSPWIAAKHGGQCLKFYYTMYGKTMGTLAIKLEKSNGVSWLIFYEKGNKGMGWKKGSGNINVDVGFRYQVRTQLDFYSCFPSHCSQYCLFHSPLSHGSHIGYRVCTLGMKSRRGNQAGSK